MTKKAEITIIIKALNEEENIARAIQSSQQALHQAHTQLSLQGEIIVADSLSTDKTVDIAIKQGAQVVQLTNPKDRSCGVGPQLGYQHSQGTYIYILDGDMELEKDFLVQGIKELQQDKQLAGVAGQVQEMRAVNRQFKRRTLEKKKHIGYADKLEMGGLYKRAAIEEVNYFSNRNLHAYEEAELGHRLTQKGWKLLRITKPGIKHYGYDTTSLGVFKKRWKSGYAKGSGEYLRAALGKRFFLNVCKELMVYIAIAAWWKILALLLLLVAFSVVPVIITAWWLGLLLVIIILMIIKKRSIQEGLFSIISWHYSAAGMMKGFLYTQKNPTKNIPSKVIK